MQIQLFITNRDYCDFYQWSPSMTQLEVVQRDEQFLNENMLPRLKEFYEAYLLEREHPERHLAPKRPELDAPQIIAEYDDAVEAIKLYEERKKELLAKLVEIAGNRSASFGTRKLTFVQKAGNVAYATLVKEKLPGVDVEPYRGKPSEYWMLSNGKEK
jgi:hypothetical protein